MDKKKYYIDNKPASARDIIIKAKKYDLEFAESNFYQTSIAAGILRENGHCVK